MGPYAGGCQDVLNGPQKMPQSFGELDLPPQEARLPERVIAFNQPRRDEGGGGCPVQLGPHMPCKAGKVLLMLQLESLGRQMHAWVKLPTEDLLQAPLLLAYAGDLLRGGLKEDTYVPLACRAWVSVHMRYLAPFP